MAIIERPSTPALDTPSVPAVATPSTSYGVWRRPVETTGWKSWLFTIDHKKLGIMYGVVAMAFFIIGGIEALLIRAQLAGPNGTVLSADKYNQMFTMHATTMVFLFVMPMAAAFANYMVPLQIGARDVAFPRINAFGFWAFLFGGLFLNTSWILGGAADGGWFMYAPNSSVAFSPTNGVDYWALGLQITGIASLTGAINLIVTVINMRAPGMSLMKVPIFTWMVMVVQFLLLFAMPVITVALFLLMFQRSFDATFFSVEAGADPLLWQHLFWIFGHPEVYIIVLPAFGIVSEVLPVFSKKPLFGYPLVVFSGAAIGFVGWGVWAHHMFASGLGPISVAVFSVATMAIAIPTGVKIVNWTLTMWNGKIVFATPMLYAVGVIVQFTIGGLSGVTHSVAPSDTQQTDTYYIVAHFHYVIFGGGVFGLFAGAYFWWPKVFGHFLNERRGKVNFWAMFVGFNLTFGPMHVLGLQGMSRRIDTYSAGFGFELWNLVATIGSYILGFSVLYFLWNVYKSKKEAPNLPPPGPDPWDARSLEWSIPSPTPEHNFDEIPVIESQDDWWFRKYNINEDGSVVRIATAEEAAQKGDAEGVHLPSPSFWPLVLAIGLPLIGYGVIFNLWLCVAGGLLTGMAIYAWALEPVDDPDAAHDHGDHDDHGDGDPVAVAAGDASESSEGES